MAIFQRNMPRSDRFRLWLFIRDACLHGQCYPFAIVLHRAFGWPMIGLVNGQNINHVVVRQPDGRYRDSRGIITEEAIGEPFGAPKPYQLREVTEAELIKRQPAIKDMELASLEQKMRVIWPKLPWPPGLCERTQNFLVELEALCKKHRLWIRAPYPTAQPIIYDAYGDEAGFEVTPDSGGSSYFFDRSLGSSNDRSEVEFEEDDLEEVLE